MNILITGATGKLGASFAEVCMKNCEHIVFLVRAKSDREAFLRVSGLIPKRYMNRVNVLCADLTQPNFGLEKDVYSNLTKNLTHIVHFAASTRFNLSYYDAYRNNVLATQQLLTFATSCVKLSVFFHVSTAYVAGKKKGIMYESAYRDKSRGFINTYQKSKAETENLVLSYINRVPFVILRPSIIIDSDTTNNTHLLSSSPLSALTLTLFLLKKGLIPLLPGTAETRLDIISQEAVITYIFCLLQKPKLNHDIYHLSSGPHAVSVGDIITLVQEKIGKNLSIEFVPDEKLYYKELKSRLKLRPDLNLIYKRLNYFLPELAYPKLFDNSHLLSELGGPPFPETSHDIILDLIIK